LPSLARAGRAFFEMSVSQRFSDEGRPLLVVKTSIPYRRLVFLRTSQGYESTYRVLMSLLDEDNDHIRGDVWEEIVTVEKYADTKSAAKVSSSQRTIPIEGGQYKVKLILEIVETSLRLMQEKEIRIVASERGGFEITEPVFRLPSRNLQQGRPPEGELLFSGCTVDDERFITLPTSTYADLDVWQRVTYNAVGTIDTTLGDEITISTRVTDFEKKVLFYGRQKVPMSRAGHQRLCIDFDIGDYEIGTYNISTVIEVAGSDARASSDGSFTVVLNRGMFGRHFDRTLELLKIIVEEKELESLSSAAPEKRFEEWERFWKGLDSTPRSPENERLTGFLLRLKEALDLFSITRPGWESDRGRIYIRHGAPDKVTNRTEGATLRNIKYWIYYSKNVVFIFEDAMGTGEYRLVETRSI